jgi:2-phosphoglycerate kinase
MEKIENEEKQNEVPAEDKKDTIAIKKRKQKRRNYSKYDFVKIKVLLGDHHFIFSRFLVSRILTLIKIQQKDAIKITLNLKKYLVDENMLELEQVKLEEYLFKVMTSFGYGGHFVNRYRMISRFYHKRVPLLILVAGTGCVGMSTLVTQLAERINISNILQTNITYKMMRSINPQFEQGGQLFDREGMSEEELIRVYDNNCRLVRKGVNFDIQKCFVDGKALIIEGRHVNPKAYVRFEETKVGDIVEKKLKLITPAPLQTDEVKENEPEKKMRSELEKVDQKDSIIIPFLLTIDETGHYLCIENRLAQLHKQEGTSYIDDKEMEKKIKILLKNYQVIQKYLLETATDLKAVKIDINNFEDTLDYMHNIILDNIEEAYSRGAF